MTTRLAPPPLAAPLPMTAAEWAARIVNRHPALAVAGLVAWVVGA